MKAIASLRTIVISFFVLLFFISGNAAPVVTQHVSQNLKSGVVLCVSLGMPDLVLRQYLQQANQFHIPLVIRGLLHNNLRETNSRIFSLLNPKDEPAIKGGIAIDPHPFRIAKIEAVPALVISDGTHYDVVYGNESIATLLHIVASDGSQDSIRAMASQLEQRYNHAF